MPVARDTELYRRDVRSSGKFLTAKEREEVMRPYLPAPLAEQQANKALPKSPQPIRSFVKSSFHFLLFTLIHIFFSLYARIRKYYHAITRRVSAILYYHHRTPELIRKDVKNLNRLPKHLSVILELPPEETGLGGLEQLLDNVAEISAWCACVGIPTLSVYERTGVLKQYIPTTHKTVAAKLHSYFGSKRPSLQVRAPHMSSYLNGDMSTESEIGDDRKGSSGRRSIVGVIKVDK
jgi:dehydrodolichyl diphosphate syntase complex subunit NUS1